MGEEQEPPCIYAGEASDSAQIRREEVVGKPLVESPWWSSSPASQAQLRAAIARASMGETVHFEALIHPREGMNLHLAFAITPHLDAVSVSRGPGMHPLRVAARRPDRWGCMKRNCACVMARPGRIAGF